MKPTRMATPRNDARAHVRFDPAVAKVLRQEAARRGLTFPGLIKQLTTERLDQLGLL